MYVIVVYDTNIKRVTKALKLCRIYFHHIQNSVFEGDITQKNYAEFREKLEFLIDKEEDSVIIFKFRKKELFDKEIVGIEKNPAENIL